MTASPSSSNASSILAQLQSGTQQAVSRLSAATGASTLSEQLDALQRENLEAGALADPGQREARLKIIEARFADVRKVMETDTNDVAEVSLNLGALLESLSDEHAALVQPNDEEQALIAAAEQEVAVAEAATKETGMWAKVRAGARKEALETAQKKLAEVRQEVHRMGRSRLMKADLGESLQQIIMLTRQVTDLIERRKKTTAEQLSIATARREATQTDAQAASEALEQLEKLLKDAAEAVASKKLELSGLTGGSPAHSAASKELSDLEAAARTAEGQRNIALGTFREKQKFAIEWQVHEETQRKLLDSQELCTTLLRIDIEERTRTVQSRLDAEKAFSDIEAASHLKKAGAKIDERNVSAMAKITAAVGNEMAETIEAMPEHLQKLNEMRAEQAEALEQFRARFSAAVEAVKLSTGHDATKTNLNRANLQKAA
jgi:hypothetical protein